jgi:hypothetical protein
MNQKPLPTSGLSNYQPSKSDYKSIDSLGLKFVNHQFDSLKTSDLYDSKVSSYNRSKDPTSHFSRPNTKSHTSTNYKMTNFYSGANPSGRASFRINKRNPAYEASNSKKNAISEFQYVYTNFDK